MKQGLNLTLTFFQVVIIVFAIAGSFSATVWRVNAQQNEEMGTKADETRVSQLEKNQEKINDKNDERFREVMNAVGEVTKNYNTTNLKLERIATQLEERKTN